MTGTIPPRPDITPLLERAYKGDSEAFDQVAELVLADLTRMASKMIHRQEGPNAWGKTLEPPMLVNETFIKLLQQRTQYQNRQHFFAIATKVMLRVLLDYHKANKRKKRGGDQIRVTLSGLGQAGAIKPASEIPDLVAALEKLKKLDARAEQVVRLRGLWGLGTQETADVMGVSRSTVDRDWKFARTWLKANL